MVTPPVQPFALEFSGQGVPVPMLEALAGQVFQQVGCTPPSADDLRAALVKATSGSTFGGVTRCDLQFRARNHALEVLVSANGGRIWQTSCAIP